MSEELIDRLKQRIKIRREMNGGRIDANTKDMQESIAAIEAITAERDALAAELKAVREQEPVAWFCYSSEAGYCNFGTLQEASSCAAEWLEECRRDAVQDGEWPEDADTIVFGAVLGRTTELKGNSDGEEWVEYQLTHPSPSRKLTDEDIETIHKSVAGGPSLAPARMKAFAHAIERHLKGEGE